MKLVYECYIINIDRERELLNVTDTFDEALNVFNTQYGEPIHIMLLSSAYDFRKMWHVYFNLESTVGIIRQKMIFREGERKWK